MDDVFVLSISASFSIFRFTLDTSFPFIFGVEQLGQGGANRWTTPHVFDSTGEMCCRQVPLLLERMNDAAAELNRQNC